MLANLQALNIKIDHMVQVLEGFKKDFSEAITDMGAQLLQLGRITSTSESVLDMLERFDAMLDSASNSAPITSMAELKAQLSALRDEFTAALANGSANKAATEDTWYSCSRPYPLR